MSDEYAKPTVTPSVVRVGRWLHEVRLTLNYGEWWSMQTEPPWLVWGAKRAHRKAERKARKRRQIEAWRGEEPLEAAGD